MQTMTCPAAGSGPLRALLIAVFIAAFMPVAAQAHPPEELLLSYDAAKRQLAVRITHSSREPARHYVRKVEVVKNKALIVSASYSDQAGAAFSYTYPLEAGPGDLVEVTAACSVFGSKTERLDMRGTLR